MAYGTRGQWNVLRGRYITAFFDGRKALKYLKKCKKLDKHYYDVDLGLGVFDYQTAQFAGLTKKLSALVGMRGDEKRGLERMHLAMNRARYSRRQAAQFLSSIYIIDKKDFAQALPIVKRLQRYFPESSYFKFLEVIVVYRMGHWDDSSRLGRELFKKYEKEPAAFQKKLLSLICSLTGKD